MMSDQSISEEGLTGATLDEAIAFMRMSNPFAQHTWGWDTGRFIDWRWGSNNIRAADNPDWFGDACRIFRVNGDIRAMAIAEYGGEAECVITPEVDRDMVGYILELLISRHGNRDAGISLEFSERAEWLREVCRTAGLIEQPASGCEWEYDLGSVDVAVVVPPRFEIKSLADRPDTDRAVLARCIELAFDTPRDLEPVLRNIETNPWFYPELSVFALSPDGVVAAYCRGTVDPHSGVCGIDPICTHPDYQKLGLGKAVVRATFAAQRRLGGRFAYIGSAPPPAPGTFLYQSLGPSDVSISCEWTDRTT